MLLKRWGLGTRRRFSKVNMAALRKTARKTNVFWTKERILSKDLATLMFSILCL